jgi:hypothetical protein
MSTLLALPQELLCYIAEFLEESDVMSLMSTCQELRRMLLQATLWRSRYLLYARTFQTNADFGLDNTPAWRLLTLHNMELQDQFYYSVDMAGQRGFHHELQDPTRAVAHAPGHWRQALLCLLSSRCEACGSYCGTVNVLLLVRVCDKCAQDKAEYKVVPLDILLSFIAPEHASAVKSLPMRSLKNESQDESCRTYVALAHCLSVLRFEDSDQHRTPYDVWLMSSVMSGRYVS